MGGWFVISAGMMDFEELILVIVCRDDGGGGKAATGPSERFADICIIRCKRSTIQLKYVLESANSLP